jgi:hypothetical protein
MLHSGCSSILYHGYFLHFSHYPLPLPGQLSMYFHLYSFFSRFLENFAVLASFTSSGSLFQVSTVLAANEYLFPGICP